MSSPPPSVGVGVSSPGLWLRGEDLELGVGDRGGDERIDGIGVEFGEGAVVRLRRPPPRLGDGAIEQKVYLSVSSADQATR